MTVGFSAKTYGKRIARIVALTAVCGCSPAVADPGANRVVGTIIGYDATPFNIDITANGLAVTVKVITYGGACDSSAGTVIGQGALTADITPYDFRGNCDVRSLIKIEHAATIQFAKTGTALLTVNGLDASRVSLSQPGTPVVITFAIDLATGKLVPPRTPPITQRVAQP